MEDLLLGSIYEQVMKNYFRERFYGTVFFVQEFREKLYMYIYKLYHRIPIIKSRPKIS